MTDPEMIDSPDAGQQLARLRAIMHRLRAPGGCPWDAEQTHASLVPNLIEEAYETVDTIQRGDHEHLKEELGDLLLQVIFHSELAEEAGRFNLDDVARGISEKLVRRHPHVFAQSDASTTDAVLQQWDEIKRGEKGDEAKPYLHGVGKGLPALLRAAKLQKKGSKVGFDWPDQTGVLAKIREETTELEAAAFRALRHHLMEKRPEVQNIDLMNLAGFCRNCLSRWYQEAAAERGIEMTKDEARLLIDGCADPHVRTFIVIALHTGNHSSTHARCHSFLADVEV